VAGIRLVPTMTLEFMGKTSWTPWLSTELPTVPRMKRPDTQATRMSSDACVGLECLRAPVRVLELTSDLREATGVE
jgi:hypothetical protein